MTVDTNGLLVTTPNMYGLATEADPFHPVPTTTFGSAAAVMANTTGESAARTDSSSSSNYVTRTLTTGLRSGIDAAPAPVQGNRDAVELLMAVGVRAPDHPALVR
jgi:hypothetical protein